jgi:hypothetical protein
MMATQDDVVRNSTLERDASGEDGAMRLAPLAGQARNHLDGQRRMRVSD